MKLKILTNNINYIYYIRIVVFDTISELFTVSIPFSWKKKGFKAEVATTITGTIF